MHNQQQVFAIISELFAGVVDVNFEGSEEYPDSHKVFLSFDLRLKNSSTNNQERLDLYDIEQWVKLSLEETFRDQIPDKSSPTSPIKANP